MKHQISESNMIHSIEKKNYYAGYILNARCQILKWLHNPKKMHTINDN